MPPSKSSSSEVASLVYQPLLKTLYWRKYGIFVWTLLIALPIIWVADATFLIVPLLGLRLFLINRTLYQFLGIRYITRIALIIVDTIIFRLVFLTVDLAQPYVDPENTQYYTEQHKVNFLHVVMGKLIWALVTTAVYHAYARSEYHLVFPSVIQRRIARIRLAIPMAIKSALKLVRHLLPILFILAIISLFIAPLNLLFKPSVLPPPPTATPQPINTAPGIDGGLNQDEVPVKPVFAARPKLPTSLIILTIARGIVNFVDSSIRNMHLFSISNIAGRIVELMWVAVVLELTWHVSSIIHTERFSFDPRARLDTSDGDELLKANNPTITALKNINRTAPLIAALKEKDIFVHLHALQDLYDLSSYHPDRRREIYTDLQEASWSNICDICVDKIENMKDLLLEVNESISQQSKSLEKDNGKSNAVSKAPTSIQDLKTLKTRLFKLRAQIDDKIRKSFQFIRPQAMDLNVKVSLKQLRMTPSLLQARTELIFTLKSLSRLMAHSIHEDSFGMIASSKKIPIVLSSMVELLIQSEMYAEHLGSTSKKRLSSPEPLDGLLLSHSFSQSLVNAVSESIYEITTTYHEHLQIYEFSSSHASILDQFLNFTL